MIINCYTLSGSDKIKTDVEDDLVFIECFCGFTNVVFGFTLDKVKFLLNLDNRFFCAQCKKILYIRNNVIYFNESDANGNAITEPPKKKANFVFVRRGNKKGNKRNLKKGKTDG